MRMNLDYEVLTEKTVDNQPDSDNAEWFEDKILEQDEKLRELGFDNDCYTCYPCHFFNSDFFDEYWLNIPIYDAVERLAIKEGADLVRFENGNIGFVAVYGSDENGFEIRTDIIMDDDDNIIEEF